jgi:hypothetical protein
MELPDDVLRIIKEYSRPLRRQVFSEYWHKRRIYLLDKMINFACDSIMEYMEYNQYNIYSLKFNNGNFDIELDPGTSTLKLNNIFLWNGIYSCFQEELDEDSNQYIRLINDNGIVVKTILIG